jgi:organic radical activating enzyme
MNRSATFFVKMVAGNEQSFKSCLEFFDLLNQRDCLMKGIMPEGRTPEEIQESTLRILPLCIEHNIQFVDRLHIRIWGGMRGV